MNILFFDWGGGSFTYPDIIEEFNRRGCRTKTVSYTFSNVNEDDFFVYRFSRVIAEGQFDFIFSVNFFPLVAKCAHDASIKYVAWCYDNPLNVPRIDESLGYESNYVFLFDRLQTEYYFNQGFERVHYLPLAVNVQRLDKVRPEKRYESDIAFVGNLYQSDIDIYKAGMDEYCRKYLDAVSAEQRFRYGSYIVDYCLNDEIIKKIQASYKLSPIEAYHSLELSKDELEFSLASSVTRTERLILLKLLGKYYKVNLYSTEMNENLPEVNYMGNCDYYTQMPQIFKSTKINMNITLKIIQSGIPLRALDIMGAGGLLLSNFQPELNEYFEDGVEFVSFASAEEAYEKATFYLKNDDIRENIASRGREKVARDFSYKKMMDIIFDTIK